MKLRTLALVAVPALLLTFASVARADDEGGSGNDRTQAIKKKMEAILELMRKNEQALLKLSAGLEGATKKVEVEVPDQPPAGSSGDEGGSQGSAGGSQGSAGGSQGSAGGSAGGSPGGTQGEEIRKKLDEALKGQREDGGSIPDQIKQLIEMIPT